jgi:autotransporter-associated beta strand protein
MWQKLQGSGFNYRIKVLNVTMLCFAVTLAIAPSSPADVVGRYAFTTIDVSESISGIPAYNGTLENGAKISDGSVVLDGTNQYVDLSYGLSSFMSALSGSCSFEAWVNWSGTGSLNQQIFDFGNGVGTDSTGAPAINPHMYISANYGTTGSGNLRYALEPAGLAKNNGPLNASGPLGTTPTYIAVVYNATRTTMANKTLYVNGVAVASFVPTADGTPFPSSLTLANNYVGKSQADEVNFFSTYFKGSISDLRFWNNALSAADISAHYTAEANGLAVWTGSSGGNFNEAAKWDTGIMPGTNTTVVIVNGNSMDLHGYGANPDDKSVGGVSLYSGTIQDSLGTGKLTSATTINVEQGAISAKLDGMTGLTKSTVNVVTLSGANTFTGGVTVNGGTLQLGNAAALGSTSNIVTINNAGSILDIYGNSPTISGIVLTNGSLQ